VLTRYRKTVLSLLRLLRQFQKNPKNTALLADIQRRLYKAICTAEQRAKKKDAAIGKARQLLRTARLPKEEAKALKTHLSNLANRKGEYNSLIHLLKSIGDGLAFTIFNRYDLKPLVFKESPGALGGNRGERRSCVSCTHS
jgi:hypothetical protein